MRATNLNKELVNNFNLNIVKIKLKKYILISFYTTFTYINAS